MILLIAVVVFDAFLVKGDPCNLNTLPVLPDASARDPRLARGTLCDDTLTEGWYNVGSRDMPKYPVSRGHCGTAWPIWMQIANNELPAVNSVKNAQACMSDGAGTDCFDFYTIKVKNCGGYRVYFLKETGFCNSAYCFEQSATGPPNITKVEVQYKTLKWNSQGVPELVFHCAFNIYQNMDLYYSVEWFIDGVPLKPLVLVQKNTIDDADLVENTITDAGYKHGINIFCRAGTRTGETTESSPTVMSNAFFAGFQVSPTNVFIHKYATGKLNLKPTVPFACEHYQLLCFLHVEIEDPDIDECQQNILITNSNRCKIQVIGYNESNQGTYYTNKDFEQTYSMDVKSTYSENYDAYDTRTQYTIALKTNVVQQKFWSNQQIANIPVNINRTDSIWQGKRCYAHTDPHMRTFDGRYYEQQEAGSYVLYTHMDLDQRVLYKNHACRNNGAAPYCVCSVVIQAGKDIFHLHLCGGSKVIDFPSCEDGTLQVMSDGDSQYRVRFPSGTEVALLIHCWPDCTYRHINVDIYPTAADVQNTKGLCGYLDGNQSNDFKKRDGSHHNINDNYPNSFSQSWSVNSSEDLFPPLSTSKIAALQAWNSVLQMCRCPYANLANETYNVTRPPRTTNDVDCSYKQYSECNTRRFKPFTCLVRHDTLRRRKKRSTHIKANLLNILAVLSSRQKRAVDQKTATRRCYEAFNASEAYALCIRNINGVDDSEINNCVYDYMATGSDSLITMAIERFQLGCSEVLWKNSSVQKDNAGIATQIFEASCLANCSGNGICATGMCECNNGYFGSDCSKDASKPPVIQSVVGDGVCDRANDMCDQFYFFGEDFLYTGNTTCKFDSTTIFTDGSRTILTQTRNGNQQSIFEAICYTPEQRHKRSSKSNDEFATIHVVSISNNGVSFSNSHTILVYDTLCQAVQNDSSNITFTLKEGYCYIEGLCILDKAISPSIHCRICNTTENMYAWSNMTDCTNETDTTLQSTVTSMGTTPLGTATLSSMPQTSQSSTVKPVTDLGKKDTSRVIYIISGVISFFLLSVAIGVGIYLKTKSTCKKPVTGPVAQMLNLQQKPVNLVHRYTRRETTTCCNDGDEWINRGNLFKCDSPEPVSRPSSAQSVKQTAPDFTLFLSPSCKND